MTEISSNSRWTHTAIAVEKKNQFFNYFLSAVHNASSKQLKGECYNDAVEETCGNE